MKKISLLVLLVFSLITTFSQTYPISQSLGSPQTLVFSRGGFRADSSLIIPSFTDTAAANLSPYVKYYAGNMIRVGDKVYIRNSTATGWIGIGSGGSGSTTFSQNIIMNGTSSNRLGNYVNGDTIPVVGLGLDSAFKIISQRAVPPTYVAPTTTISSSPSEGNYEIGSALSLTFSSTFTQNDAGSLTATTYYKNNTTALASNTDNIASLTSTTQYKVTKTYNQGACKVNNLGVLDCTGRINAGNVTSTNITFTPLPKRYWGYTSSSAPNSSQIITASGGGSQLTTSKDKIGFSVVVTGTNQYVYYAYPTSFGVLTSIVVSGLESIGAFNQTTVSVTNAQGYAQNYYVYTSKNQFNNTTVTFTSVN